MSSKLFFNAGSHPGLRSTGSYPETTGPSGAGVSLRSVLSRLLPPYLIRDDKRIRCSIALDPVTRTVLV